MSKRALGLAALVICVQSLGAFAQEPGTRKWYYRLGEPSSPALGRDGTIYVGTRNGVLHAINPDGTAKWKRSYGCIDYISMPVIGSDDTIYSGCSWPKDEFHAIDPDGNIKWSKPWGASGPAIGADGTLYVGHYDGATIAYILHALNPDGSPKWGFPVEGVIHRPSISVDGTIYFASEPGILHAVYPDGTERWSLTLGGRVIKAPAIGADGTVYVGAGDSNLYAVNPDGSIKWTFRGGGAFFASPAIAEDGTIYVGCQDYSLYAINPDGTEKWIFPTYDYVTTTPALGADGTIYFTSSDGSLYALTPDGEVRWSDPWMSIWWNSSSPVIGPDGTLYVGGNGGGYQDHFYAYYTDSGDLAPSPWPMIYQNPNHTSRRRPLDLPPEDLMTGDPVEAQLPAGEVHRYLVETVRDRNLLIELVPGEGVDGLVLDAGFNDVAHPGAGQYSTTVPTQRGPYELLISPTADGAYMITVLGTRVAVNGGSYTLTARYVDAHLSDLSPRGGGNVGIVSVSIQGLGFHSGLDVALGGAGLETRYAENVDIVSAVELIARFDLTGLNPGDYDLSVSWPGGTRHSLARAFAVSHGMGASLDVTLAVPEAVRRGRQYVYWLEYGNDGDTDLRAPLLYVTSPQNVPMRLSTDKPFTRGGLQVLGISSSHPAGVLRPGERYRVPVYFMASSSVRIDFDVARLRADGTAIDWQEVEEEIRPNDVVDELWSASFGNLKNSIGSDWRAYEQSLAGAASYLSRYGKSTHDAADLFGLLFQRAMGSYLGETHAFNVDAYTTARHIPLFFSRVARGGLYQRFTPGQLGRCWSHAFEYELTRPQSDQVVIRVPGGSTRKFFIDRNGNWRGPAGEHGRLEEVSGGGFVLYETSGLIMDFDPGGRLTRVLESNGNGLTLSYAGSQLESISHSNGQSISLEYNADGLIQYLTDHAGRVTEYIYDPGGLHLLEQVIAPGGVTTGYSYRPATGTASDYALVSVEHPDGTSTYYDFDSWGRLSSWWLEGFHDQLSYVYDRFGSVVETDALDHSASIRIGLRGETLEFENHLRERFRLEYDFGHDLRRVLQPDDTVFELAYDTRGNPIEIVTPLGNAITAGYTSNPTRLDWFRDAVDHLIDFEYSSGNPTLIEYPDGSQEGATYDGDDGDLATVTNRRGEVISMVHNDLGELIDIDWDDGTWFDFSHDEYERRWSFTADGGTTTLYFDERGMLESVEWPDGHWLRYTFSDAGWRERLETDDDFALDYHYDEAGRLEYLTDGTGFEIVRYRYDEVGRLTREYRGNGTSTVYGYDAADRLLSVMHFAADASVQAYFNYSYDRNGNPGTMTTVEGTTVYDYDGDGRLVQVTYPDDHVVGFEYDAAGNRRAVTFDGAPVDYEVNDLNQYTMAGDVTFAYDDNGNLEALTESGGTTIFSWDHVGRLTAIESPADGTWTFSHSAVGNRIGIDHDGQKRHFLTDPVGNGEVVAEYDDAGNLLARYIHGLGLAARLDAAGNYAYYGFDATGNTRQVTNVDGVVVNSYDYTPFGIPISVVEAVPNPFRFGGLFGVMDDGHGMLDMRARFYDPSTGRFISPDPIGLAGGPNLYTYVGNSPVRYADPIGLLRWESRSDLEASGQEFENAAARLGSGSTPEEIQASIDRLWGGRAGFINSGGHWVMQESILHYAGEGIGRGVHAGLKKVLKHSAPGQRKTIIAVQGGIAATNLYNPGSDLPPPKTGAGSDWQTGDYSDVVTPVDPNEKVGPAGVGDDHLVTAGEEMSYTVYFENLSTATAPAQEVFVNDCLDRNLNWTTFRLNDVVFGDTTAANTTASPVFEQRVSIPDYRAEEEREWWVDVSSSFDLSTGCFRMALRQIDPDTGDLPLDPFAGILPPEDGSGRGQGHLSYTVNARGDLGDGRVIRNRASIVFDTNEPISTNEVFNTIGVMQQNYGLALSLAGDGSGTVTSAPPGIDCGSVCAASFLEGTVVELQAVADAGSEFVAWGGDDDCGDGIVIMSTDVACEATFEISNQPPVAVVGDDQTLFADEVCQVQATLDGRGSYDPDDDPLTYLWQSDFGDVHEAVADFVLPLGAHEFTLTVTDDQDAVDTDTVTVTVEDGTPPVIELSGDSEMTVECLESYTEAGATAHDNCDTETQVVIGGQEVDSKILGGYVITYDATDSAGNTAIQMTRTVTVADSVPPWIESASAEPEVLWPPNHNMVSVEVTVSTADGCDSTPPSCSVMDVSSDEPETGCGSGRKTPDAVITGDLTVDLRAERCGDGDGRVYTIVVSCTDGSGNSSSAATTVTVPHDQQAPARRPAGRRVGS